MGRRGGDAQAGGQQPRLVTPASPGPLDKCRRGGRASARAGRVCGVWVCLQGSGREKGMVKIGWARKDGDGSGKGEQGGWGEGGREEGR